MSISFTDILAARKRISLAIAHTPLRRSEALSSRTGLQVLIKCEHHQTTGSFKLRGATNAVLSLSGEQREAGVTGASTGNHGRALAYAAALAGARAVICMSRLVPKNKVDAIEALGAEARIVGDSQDDAQKEVDRLVKEEGMSMVSPFDFADVIAGQGTLGLEILEEAPELETIVVPLSGGGLIAGVALAAKTVNPEIRIVGVTMERGAAMHASLAAGHPVDVREVATLADSLGGGIGLNNTHTFAMVRELVDDVVLVSEAQIADGIRSAYFDEGEVIEGAAAVGIAALDAGLRPKGPACVILTGKNIDMELHRRIVNGETPELDKEGGNG